MGRQLRRVGEVMCQSSTHVNEQRTRAHFYPQHWLLCHMGLYKFEFEFEFAGVSLVPRA